MLQFFQVLFFLASITVIVLNILQFNKYQEGRKTGANIYPIKWFSFSLNSLVAIGCAINIIVSWIQKG
jgi:hypothetical protein